MKTEQTLFGIPFAQWISLGTFLLGVITIWIHLEVRIAEVNVEIVNLKKDLDLHKSDNRRDLEGIRGDMQSNTREIVGKIDEIQIYLRDHRP
jgi:hypothetical protein